VGHIAANKINATVLELEQKGSVAGKAVKFGDDQYRLFGLRHLDCGSQLRALVVRP
jgi:hypothetical protein